MDIWINKNKVRLKNNKYYQIIIDNNYEKMKLYSYEKKYLKSFKISQIN